MALNALEEANLIAWSVPEPPGGHAAGVPRRAGIRLAIPEHFQMPAEAEHRLATDAAPTRPKRESLLSVGRGRRPEAKREINVVFPCDPPRPALRSTTAGRQSACEAIGSERVMTPVALNRPRQGGGNERAGERMLPNR
jgi:hypothetical protein